MTAAPVILGQFPGLSRLTQQTMTPVYTAASADQSATCGEFPVFFAVPITLGIWSRTSFHTACPAVLG